MLFTLFLIFVEQIDGYEYDGFKDCDGYFLRSCLFKQNKNNIYFRFSTFSTFSTFYNSYCEDIRKYNLERSTYFCYDEIYKVMLLFLNSMDFIWIEIFNSNFFLNLILMNMSDRVYGKVENINFYNNNNRMRSDFVDEYIWDCSKSGNIKINHLEEAGNMNPNYIHYDSKGNANWKENIQTRFFLSTIHGYNVNIEKNILLQVFFFFFVIYIYILYYCIDVFFNIVFQIFFYF
jgi:hypothetical protein